MYENFYQLRAKPFRLSPDPSFFFASRGHKRALAYLRYGLSQAEGFVVITGAPGTGKTTLAQILLQEMDQSDVVVAHLTTTQLEADEMLRMVMASFGLRYEGQDKAALLKTLEAFFMARSRENKRVLLVVDEAQNLPARSLEELRMLSNLQVGERALLQTFLLGQVQFRQMLDHPDLEQLRQRVIANYHLSALGEDECQSYIESRLAHVGWNNDPHFTGEAFEIIYKYTEGVPRRINMLCDRVLLFSSLEEQHTINADVLQDVTDELQSEISGRPIARPKEKPAASSAPEPVFVAETPEPIPDITPSEPVLVKEAKEDAPEADEVNTDTPHEPAVSEPVISEPLVAEDHAAAISFPNDGGMDRAVPDDGWMQHVAQAQPDHIEIDEEHVGNNEPAEMERFRVIAGGKEAANNTGSSRPANQHSSDVMAPLPDAPGDSQEVVLRKILRLVLAFHRSPRSFPGLDDPTQPLPNGIKAILELAIADDQVLSGLRQIAIMGISPSMLRAAVRFFVRRVLFLVGGDDFRVLGLATNASLTEVEVHYGLLMKLLRQDKKANDESGVLRVGEAYERLCRSEITSRPREPVEIFDSVDDISDAEEELDLDLSPSVGLGANAGMRSAPAPSSVNGGAIVTDGERTAPTARNLMLIAGATVIVFVLYLTQIKTTEDVVPEVAVDLPTQSVVVAVPVTKQEVVVAPVPVVEEVKTVDEDIVSSELVQSTLVSNENLLVEKTAATAEVEEKLVAAEKAREIREAKEALQVATAAKLQLEAEIKARADAQAKEEERVAAEIRRIAEEEAQVTAKLMAEAAAKAEAVARAEAQAKAKAQAEAQAQAEAKVIAVAKAAAQQKIAAKEKALPKPINVASLDTMLLTFSSAYQAGELNKLLGLYSTGVRTNKYIDVAGLRVEYQALFANSSSRSVQFKNVNWERKNGYAHGSGQYIISVTGKSENPSYTESGDVTLQVEDRSGKLQIIRYYTSNVVVSERAGTKAVVSATVAPVVATSPARIEVKELGALLNMLVNAYAAGDIYTFMQLFSKDAQTNDQATVEGIRGDYKSLFDSTSYRSIAFNNMNWTWDNGVARGDGAYDVEVQANGQSKRNRYQGQVWIQMERKGGNVRITHFAFVE